MIGIEVRGEEMVLQSLLPFVCTVSRPIATCEGAVHGREFHSTFGVQPFLCGVVWVRWQQRMFAQKSRKVLCTTDVLVLFRSPRHAVCIQNFSMEDVRSIADRAQALGRLGCHVVAILRALTSSIDVCLGDAQQL